MNMKLSIADRIVRTVSPKAYLSRVGYRMRGDRLVQFGDATGATNGQRSETKWRGASQTLRSVGNWITTLGSGRSDTSRAERERMAARSTDAYRNHLVARAVVTRMRTNIVGTGLQMHPAVNAAALGISEEQADELNAVISREWSSYYDNPTEVDIEATNDGAGLQGLALVTAILGGDCFASTPYEERQNGLYGIKVQLIDPGRVNNQNNAPNTSRLQDGIELSLSGMPLAIHVANKHPGEQLPDIADGWQRLDIWGGSSGRRRIFQIWNDKDRIGITRGVPALGPILEPLQTLEQYSRSELMAAVVSSMFTVFIEKSNEAMVDEQGNLIPAIEGQTTDKGPANDLQLGNAAILDLAKGEKATFANPARPNSNYDPFFMAIVKQIGAALEIPLDELLLNYSSSYSAARAAMLQAWRFYTMRRWWLVQQFCQPHYALWFDEAVARGRIPVADYADPIRRAAYTQAVWIGPARGAMDETKEVQAAKARIDSGLSNEQIESAAMMGEDRREIYAQRKREVKQREQDGMVLAPAAGTAPIQPAGASVPQPNKPNVNRESDPNDDDPTDPGEVDGN